MWMSEVRVDTDQPVWIIPDQQHPARWKVVVAPVPLALSLQWIALEFSAFRLQKLHGFGLRALLIQAV